MEQVLTKPHLLLLLPKLNLLFFPKLCYTMEMWYTAIHASNFSTVL